MYLSREGPRRSTLKHAMLMTYHTLRADNMLRGKCEKDITRNNNKKGPRSVRSSIYYVKILKIVENRRSNARNERTCVPAQNHPFITIMSFEISA